ncbi:MAG TPA: putative quinol monooxygenase [Acidobacteriaceae bacterium]|nr:putative quinol monooxygenase [Acidobacteriaceae bacterium]
MAENTDGVVLMYTAKAKPGKEHELKKFLVSLVTASRHDPGNISYELHEVAGEPGTFIFYEQWISQEMLDAHTKTPGLKEFAARAEELMGYPFEQGMKKLTKLRPDPEKS